jgi:hypothetical protein
MGRLCRPDKEQKMLTTELWQEALDVQNACNLGGLIHSLPRVIAAVQEEAHALGAGTAYVNTHPIVRLWLDKLCDLSGMTVSQRPVLDAYQAATEAGAVLR